MREWLYSVETMGGRDRSKYPAKWVWHLIIHRLIPEDWKLETVDRRPTLNGIDLLELSFTGKDMEDFGFEKGQNGKSDRVNIFGQDVTKQKLATRK